MRFSTRRDGDRLDGRDVLLVSRGRVACPRRGDTDIEACFVCGWMVEPRLDDAQPSLRCVADRGPAMLDRMAFVP